MRSFFLQNLDFGVFVRLFFFFKLKKDLFVIEAVIWKFLGSVNFGSMLFNGPFSLRTVILVQEIFIWKRTLYDRIRIARDLDLDLI